MEIWCNMLYHNVGINKKDSDYIISTKNRWNNIYQNDYYNTIIHNNIEIHNFVYSLFKENEPLPNKGSQLHAGGKLRKVTSLERNDTPQT